MDNHKPNDRTDRLHGLSRLLVIISFLMLPLCTLPLFAVHSSKFYEVLGFQSLDGAQPGCIARNALVNNNQCASWQAPGSIKVAAVLFTVTLLVFGSLLNYYAGRRVHKEAKRFANWRFVSGLLSVATTLIAYMLMRDASQNSGSYDFGFISVNLIHDHYVPAQVARFGYGLTPALLTLLIIAYILPAFISWYRFIFSQRHVGGQKKQALFQ